VTRAAYKLTSLHPRASLRNNSLATSHWGAFMHRHRPTAFFATLTFVAVLLAQAASAQGPDRMKATAPEKMMPSDKAQKMRECEKRANQQKIKMEERSRFVNECIAAGSK
jgi:hypothetical protein